MSKKNKKDKELDIILEQLKKSYGAESSDVVEDLSYESHEAEEDAELSAVLSKLFSEEQEAIESKSEGDSEDNGVIENETSEPETSDENTIENEILELETSDENTIENEILEPETSDDNTIENETSEPETSDDNTIENEILELETSDENTIENEILESEHFDTDEKNEKEEFYESEELDYGSLEPDDIDSLESTNFDPEFAVEDEEYDVLADSLPEEVETSFGSEDITKSTVKDETDELLEDLSEQLSNVPLKEVHEEIYEEVYKKTPVLILDPSQYTHDPLQEGLPKFKPVPSKTELPASTPDLTEANDPDKAEDFDSNDISLLLKLGYDDEIKSKVGGQKTQNVILESNRNFIPEDNQKPYGFCGEELVNRDQIPQIQQKYKSNKRSLLITLASVSILFLLILSVAVYFDAYSSRIDGFPILIAIEFVLVASIAAILYKKLYSSVVNMIKLVSDNYSVLLFVFAVYVLYDISALLTYAVNRERILPSEIALFGTCVALYALLTVTADYVNCIKEAAAIDLIASSNNLFTAEKVALNGINSAHSEEVSYKIRKTSLISGYFKKTSQSRPPVINLIYVLGVVPLIALIIGCAFAISSANVMTGITSATISVLLCIPFSCVCIFSFNEYAISAKLGTDKVAFIGYDAATEYSRIQNLTFKDRDVIFITSYSEIYPQNAHGQSSLEIAYEIFNTLEGTLAEHRFSTEIRQLKTQNQNVVVNSVSDNGIDINYALSTNILLGDKNYMRAHNIKVKTDSSLYGATKGSDRSVLYMAFNGVPKLGFIIGSRIAPEFIKAAHELELCGVKVFVESYEPHVNDLYFEQNADKGLAVGVFKPQTYDPYICEDIGNGNVVCASDGFNLAKLIPISKRIVRQRKICKFINYGLMSAGFVLSVLLAFAINSKSDSALFEFIKTHCSLIINLILLMGLVPGLIALLKFNKDKSVDDTTTIQNGDTKKK